MRLSRGIAGCSWPAFVLAAMCCSVAAAQNPIPVVVPIVADTAAPIIIKAVKPKTTNGLARFQGTVMHANIAEITVRAKDNELSIRSFSLSQPAADKMQKIIDKGGYQFGDKVTVFYDPSNLKAVKIKGKASRPI
jgi:hypothetical protein